MNTRDRTVFVSRQEIVDTVVTLYRDGGPLTLKLTGASIAVLLTTITTVFTSIAAVAMAGFFLCDLALGVLKVFHRDGILGFDGMRMLRGFIKLAAAVVGLLLMTLGDVVLHLVGVPEDRFLLVTAFLSGASYSFFWSALKNLGYFFPETVEKVRQRFRTAVQKA